MNRVPKKFVGLHAHSGFGSIFDALGEPSKHIDFVIKNEMDSWALTEHGNMNSYASAYIYSESLKKKGINFKYIPGIEFYFYNDLEQWAIDYEKHQDEKKLKKLTAKKEVSNKNEDEVGEEEEKTTVVEDESETKSGKKFNPINKRNHLIVLPKNSKALESLFNLVSWSFVDGFYRYPRVDYQRLKEIGKDLIASTACIGGKLASIVFDHQIIENHELWFPNDDNHDLIMNQLENEVDKFVDVFGVENFFLELQYNKLPAQHLVNKYLIELSKKTGLKLLSTADSHYPTPDAWQARELYRQLGWINKSGKEKALPQSIDDLKAQLYPKNAEQMFESYKEYCKDYDFYDDDLICDSIERSYDIAHDLIGDVSPDKTIKLPSYVVPKDTNPLKELARLAKEGLIEKGLYEKDQYRNQLKYELSVIKDKEFSEYFLTVKKIMDLAKENMLVGFGRGSAASSLLSYALGISGLDPLKYNFVFERFLSKDRQGYVDIDSDFSDRDKLLTLLRKEFGENNVIAISNFNTLGLKSLVKDISKYYDIEFQEVNIATKFVERQIIKALEKEGVDRQEAKINYENAMKHSPEFKNFIERHPQVGQFVKELQGELRSLGKHAGGVIVSEKILERMPVIVSKKTKQTPWVEAQIIKQLEPFGWIKIDLLGVETLKIFERCIELILEKREGKTNITFKDIREWHDKYLHPDILDLDDQKVYEHVFHNGNFAGIFQLTNKDTQKFFQKAKPRSIVELAALTSIYRPGPLKANVDKLYLEAKENPDLFKDQHPIISETLKETHGLLCFQEQTMLLGGNVGNFSPATQDKLRKISSKKPKPGDAIYKEAEKLREEFVEGGIKNGISKEECESLYDKILDFSKYSFNKSHAVSYSINSYICAYLLTYFEQEWLCAYLETMQSKPEDKQVAISEIKSFGYSIPKIDINTAVEKWTIVSNNELMPAMTLCKGVGEVAVEEIKQNRPYKNIYEFLWNEDGTLKHEKANKRVISHLIKIEAFDSLNCVGEDKLFCSYRQMHDVILENWDLLKKKLKKDSFLTQVEKLNNLVSFGFNDGPYPKTYWSKSEQLLNTIELLGEANVEKLVPRSIIDRLQSKSYDAIDEIGQDDGRYLCWGVLMSKERKISKNGKQYLLCEFLGNTGKLVRTFCWDWNFANDIQRYNAYVFIVERNDWGVSCSLNNFRKINVQE